MQTIDLFSGIGGFSYALHSVARTVAYCEKDPDCHVVLKRAMDSGHITKAPIYNDVTTFDSSPFTPELITAGFPCTNISGANPNGSGINGQQSKLFYTVMDIIDRHPTVKCVLLENSPCIRTRGLAHVIKALSKRGFKCVWGYFTAAMVGALHIRKRWVCLAYRTGSCLQPVKISNYNWKALPKKRLIEKKNTTGTNVKRCMMLGNSVVPQMIQFAWNTLVDHACKNHTGEIHLEYVVPKCRVILADDHGNVVEKTNWATPTFTTWHQYRTMTDRSTRILGNQIYYEESTHGNGLINQRSKIYDINPIFVEHLMGYPRNWTSI